MSIPRRLIQTGKSSELRPSARAAVANLTLLHPDWDYLFFDDAAVSRFVTSEFPQYESIFKAFAIRSRSSTSFVILPSSA